MAPSIDELYAAINDTFKRHPECYGRETSLKIRYLEGETFIAAVRQSPALASIFLDAFAGCLYDSVCTARQLMFDPLDVRLAHLLSEQFNQAPDQTINFTHEDIANELGTTRVVASRMLKKLEHADCIHLCRRKIALKDANTLKTLANNGNQANGPAAKQCNPYSR